MASTGVKLGHGSTVRIGRGVTPTWTSLTNGAGDITLPSQVRPNIDVTHMGSPNATEEAILGLFPVADWSLSLHYVQGNPVDVLLSDLVGTDEIVLLEITPAGGTALTWAASVSGWTPTLEVKGAQKAELKMIVMARVVS